MTSWLGKFPHLRQQLPRLEVVPEASSTNEMLKSLAFADYAALLTDNQTAGRGRLGRTWESTPGQGLAFSLVVPETPPPQQQWLPLVTGASVVKSLRTQGVPDAQLKWPNDVLVDERKLAGILCEVRSDGRVIVGIGLNVDYSLSALPSEVATSLAELGQTSHERVDTLLATVVSSLRRFLDAPLPEALDVARKSVQEVLATLGREVSVHDLEGSSWRGFALALTDEGNLKVREIATGKERIVVASDVRHLRQ